MERMQPRRVRWLYHPRTSLTCSRTRQSLVFPYADQVWRLRLHAEKCQSWPRPVYQQEVAAILNVPADSRFTNIAASAPQAVEPVRHRSGRPAWTEFEYGAWLPSGC